MILLRIFLKKSAIQLFHKNKFLFTHGILRTSSLNLQVSQDSNANQKSYRYQININDLRKKISSYDFVKLTDIKMILNVLKEKESMTSSEALFLLRNCGDLIAFEEFNVRITLTNEIWNLIKQFDVALDVTHFNSLLQAYIENGSEIDSSEIFEMMKNKNIKPNRITYSKLIQKNCQHGDIEGANKFLQIMSEENHSIDESVFNSLIIGNSRANDMDGALEVINIMKEKGMLIERNTFECLMKLHSENNNFEKFEETLAEAKKEDISISSKTLFDSYVKFILHKNIDASNKIHSMLPLDQPVKFIASHLLKLVKAEEYDIANDLISFSKKSELLHHQYRYIIEKFAPLNVVMEYFIKLQTKEQSNELLWEKLISDYIKLEQMEKAFAVLKYMKNHQLNISHKVQHHFLNNLKKENISVKDVAELLNYFNEYSVDIAVKVYSFLDMTDPLKTIEETLHEDCPPCRQRYYNCFVYLLRNSRFVEALEFFKTNGHFSEKNHLRCIQEIGDSFSSNTTCINEAAEFAAMYYQFCKLQKFVTSIQHFIKAIDNSLASHPNKQEIMFQLLKQINVFGLHLSDDEITFLKSKCSCLSPEVEDELNKMKNNIPTVLYTNVVSELKQHSVIFEPSAGYFKTPPMIQLIKEFTNYYHDGLYNKAEDTYKSMGSAPIEVKFKLISMYYDQHRYDDLLKIVASINIQNFILPTNIVMYQIEALVSLGRINDSIEKIKSVDSLLPDNNLLIAITNLPHDDLITLKNVIMEHKNAPKTKMNIIHNIKSNNLELALENIQNECESSGKLVFKQEFYMQCIQNEQPELLQKFHDYLIQNRGKTYAINCLAVSFLKMKKVKQARHLLQTVEINTKFYDALQQYFHKQNDTEGLQNLLKVLPDIPSDWRIHLYEQTMKHFIDINDLEKVLHYWTNIQDENLQLTDKFSVIFAKFLTDKGEDVPFTVPQDIPDKPTN